MTSSNGVPNIVPAAKLAKDKEVEEVMKMIDSAVPKDAHTKAADAARFADDEAVLTLIAQRDLANTQLELAQEQMKQLRQQAPERVSTVNTTININFPAQPAPQQRRLNPDASLVVSFAVLTFALAVAAFMAYGLRDGWLRPFAVVSNPAPITVPAPAVRVSGMVDISAVAENDRGIDYRSSRQNGQGLYELFQLSTGYTISQNGTTVLIDAAGNRIFR